MLKAVCVFCGSKSGSDSRYAETAEALGRQIVKERCDLVYGGGSIGLMGIVADAVADAGGRVTAIIPKFLDDFEVGRRNSDEFIIVESMHERKAMMADRSDAFIVLPGGLGTLDETFEILTWKQLRLHAKPTVILNAGGYWTPFIDLVDSQIANGFVAEAHRDLFSVVETVDEVFPAIRETSPFA